MENQNSTRAVTDFVPEFSTDIICVGEDYGECLTDTIEELKDHTHTPASIGAATASHTHTEFAAAGHTHVEYAASSHNHDSEYSAINHEHSAYATASHTHTGFASSVHGHSISEITNLETELGSKAAASHSHTPASIGAAPSSHTHAQSEISGLSTALSGKASVSHTHAQSEITNLSTTLAGKADLVNGIVPASQLPAYVSDIVEKTNLAAFPSTGESGKIYVAQDTNKTYRWSGSGYVEIAQGVALGETSATAYRGDRGKTAYDHSQNGTVHVTEAQKTAWNNKAEANHTHAYAPSSHTHEPSEISTNSTNRFMTDAEKTKLAGIEASANNYTHPSTHAASMITGLATVATSGNYNDLNGRPTIPTIPSSLPANGGNADTVDGYHASSFAQANHTHAQYALANPTSIKVTGQDLNNYLEAGIFTFSTAYAPANIPVGVNGWLFVIPWKEDSTTVKQIWMRHGTVGENDCDIYVRTKVGDDPWGDWRAIFVTSPGALWYGAKYMTADHTITPSKPLSECQHGWILEWCDFDAATSTANDFNYVQTVVYKRNVGGNWIGQNMMVSVPSYIGDDGTGTTHALKQIRIYNDRIEGHVANRANSANADVVLRAVYEF